MKWKSCLGSKGTYKALIEVFLHAGQLTYADFVCNLLSDTEQMGKFYIKDDFKIHTYIL